MQQTFVLNDQKSISAMQQYTHTLEKGLIVVTGSDQGWVDFILCGLLGTYQVGGVTIIPKNDPSNNYYYKHLPQNPVINDSNKILYYYGAIRNTETLKQALESAKDNVVVCAMHVIRADDVPVHMQEMLGDNGENFDDYKDLLRCVVAYEESGYEAA